jgi:hypothetical protein
MVYMENGEIDAQTLAEFNENMEKADRIGPPADGDPGPATGIQQAVAIDGSQNLVQHVFMILFPGGSRSSGL